MTPARSRDVVVGLFAAALAAGAVLLLLGPLRGVSGAAGVFELPWWALAPLFAVTEMFVASVQLRRESLALSFAEVPLVLGLAFCDPRAFVAASLLGSLVGLLHHRQTGLKLLFNLALFAFEAALGLVIYHAVLGAADPTDARGFLAAIATIVATQLVSAVAVTLVMLVMVGEFDAEVIRESMSSALVAALANSSVGLLVVVLLTVQPNALVLLLVVLAALTVVYRGYTRLSRGAARTESLYRFTDRLGDAVHTDDVVEAVLREARDVLTAENAELLLLAGEGRAPAHLVLEDDGVVPGAAEPAGTWWRPALLGRAVLRDRDESDDAVRDGVAAPLRVDDVVVGVLVVSNRLHHVDTFGARDLRLFTSLANHAALALHKADLVDRLAAEAALQEHRSLHDALTGLPNWRRFLQVAEARLVADPAAAVVVVDLDGFKDINDAFGHPTGDALLVEMGRRLAGQVGADAVARLGNDEFALLLPAGDDTPERTRALLDAVTAPFPINGLDVHIRASAGLACAPVHGDDAATLLQHADTALYVAKQRRSEVEVYDPAADGAATRVVMTGHLREAIAQGGLEVHYQPKVDPATGRPVGAEALVRWNHPAHGQVSPEEFVRLAEHTGLILPLTSVVLEAALRACADWRQDGAELGIAVNLSARSLTDAALPGLVRDALAAAGVPGDALTLEITETAVMGDLNRSLAVLHELRDLGVHLSVDDFGTGQSSLAYLKRLPIDEMKIDKSFVLHLADQQADSEIVRATIGLGHALGLRVVAEGVEDVVAQDLLAGWGCDVVQGFHIARPLPLEDLLRWLGRNPPAPLPSTVTAIPPQRTHQVSVASSVRTRGTPGR